MLADCVWPGVNSRLACPEALADKKTAPAPGSCSEQPPGSTPTVPPGGAQPNTIPPGTTSPVLTASSAEGTNEASRAALSRRGALSRRCLGKQARWHSGTAGLGAAKEQHRDYDPLALSLRSPAAPDGPCHSRTAPVPHGTRATRHPCHTASVPHSIRATQCLCHTTSVPHDIRATRHPCHTTSVPTQHPCHTVPVPHGTRADTVPVQPRPG